MVKYEEVENWFDFLKEMKEMNLLELKNKFGIEWRGIWRGLQNSKEGEVSIQVIEGGNEYMQPGGPSRCGYTPGIQVGVPIVIEFPNGGWYKGGTIEEIDWEKGIFKTIQSTYSFHFIQIKIADINI